VFEGVTLEKAREGEGGCSRVHGLAARVFEGVTLAARVFEGVTLAARVF
jgi:hypothetical protein